MVAFASPILRLATPPAVPEPVSPELALVDPDLRRRLIEESQDEYRAEPRLELVVDLPLPPRAPVVVLDDEKVSRGSGSRKLVLAALFGAAIAVVTVFGFESQSFESRSGGSLRPPAKSASAVPARTPSKTPAAVPERAQRARPAARTGHTPGAVKAPTTSVQQFSWAPAAGVDSYDVAIYKNDVPVFRTTTKSPSVAITEAHSQAAATGKAIAPGTYEWYVWPVRNGHRAAAAIVRSKLEVPER